MGMVVPENESERVSTVDIVESRRACVGKVEVVGDPKYGLGRSIRAEQLVDHKELHEIIV
jgi:hypothetical protein